MSKKTKLFIFDGATHADYGFEAVERNYEAFYYQLRENGHVPVLGTEELTKTDTRTNNWDWQLKIVGQASDQPWAIRHVDGEGDIEWFTTTVEK